MGAQATTALVRIWLRRGDVLDLVASAGASRVTGESWSGTGGAHRCFRLGEGKIGRVGASGTGMLLHDMSERSAWIVRPDWARAEGVKSVAAQPLVWEGSVVGVVAVFARARIDGPAFASLRMMADQLAAVVVATRAAGELRRRARALERENAGLRTRLFGRSRQAPPLRIGPPDEVLSASEWRQRERANIEAALRRSGGRIYGSGGAALLLGVPPTTLSSRMKALGIAVR
jgi:transcriptional regulator with GAF, ATPase, and Fis domain